MPEPKYIKVDAEKFNMAIHQMKNIQQFGISIIGKKKGKFLLDNSKKVVDLLYESVKT